MSRKGSREKKPSTRPPGKDVHILIVEDERHLADSIARRLQEEGYVVDVANDGESGFDLACTKKYDLIILDLLLPRKEGLHVLRGLTRNRFQRMRLILTARSRVARPSEGR